MESVIERIRRGGPIADSEMDEIRETLRAGIVRGLQEKLAAARHERDLRDEDYRRAWAQAERVKRERALWAAGAAVLAGLLWWRW